MKSETGSSSEEEGQKGEADESSPHLQQDENLQAPGEEGDGGNKGSSNTLSKVGTASFEEENVAGGGGEGRGRWVEEDDDDDEDEEQEGEWYKEAFRQRLFKKFAEEPIKLRVHDVKIQGNLRTKDPVIEAEFEKVKNVQTSHDLLREVALAITRLESLGIFEDCVILLEPGPVELAGTANVIVDVKEAETVYSGDVGIYSKPEVGSFEL